MNIVLAPNFVLSNPAKKVVNFDNDLKKLADQMVSLMRAAKGVGLAANQIGVTQQVIAIEYTGQDLTIPLVVVVNPRVISASAAITTNIEGCLSLPGRQVNVARSKALKIKGFNLKGKLITIAAKGFFARIIQHEMDHLSGVLITDRGKIVN